MQKMQIRFVKNADLVSYNAIVKCPFCGKDTVVKNIPAEGLFLYNQGELIQRAFPNVSPEYREVLLSGMCPKCQQEVFGSWGECDEDECENEENEESNANA